MDFDRGKKEEKKKIRTVFVGSSNRADNGEEEEYDGGAHVDL